jgi:hypothetical protein
MARYCRRATPDLPVLLAAAMPGLYPAAALGVRCMPSGTLGVLLPCHVHASWTATVHFVVHATCAVLWCMPRVRFCGACHVCGCAGAEAAALLQDVSGPTLQERAALPRHAWDRLLVLVGALGLRRPPNGYRLALAK